jgi:poly(A) polymerase
MNLMETVARLEPRPTPAQLFARARVLARIGQACAQAAGCPVPLHLFGSARLGVESLRNDVDLLALIPVQLERVAFLRRVGQELESTAELIRLVDVGAFAFLHVEVHDVRLELQVARRAGRQPPGPEDRDQVDPESWLAIAACLEADLILESGRRRVGTELFLALLLALRAWARARALTGNAWGLLANFSWAVLAAWTAGQSEARTVEELLENLFSTICSHDWRIPVSLGPAPRDFVDCPYPIFTALSPFRNTTYNLTKSTTRLISDEIARAAECARARDWEALFAPAPLADQADRLLVVTAHGQSRVELGQARRGLKEAMGRLLVALEAHVPIRPWPEARMGENSCQMAVGLGRGEHEAALACAAVLAESLQQRLGTPFSARIVAVPRTLLPQGTWP